MFNPYQHLKQYATEHVDIKHTDDSPRIFRISGIAGMEELLGKMTDIEFPSVLVEVNEDGNFGDESQSDNYLDKPARPFFIVARSEPGDADSMEQSRQTTKRIALEFVARLIHEKHIEGNRDLMGLDVTNIPYQTIGPFGSNIIGTMVTLRLQQYDSNAEYNADKWQRT